MKRAACGVHQDQVRKLLGDVMPTGSPVIGSRLEATGFSVDEKVVPLLQNLLILPSLSLLIR